MILKGAQTNRQELAEGFVQRDNVVRKIKDNFNDTEQQMFVSSFYCYLNYNQKNDFVIDLDDVWKWIGFSTKQKAKLLLEKQFINDIDYKSLLIAQVKQTDHTKGGHNKETIMLSISTFKLFCLKAGTKKADQIHDYYIKLEEILQEIIQEESNELKLQLEQKTNQLEQHIIISVHPPPRIYCASATPDILCIRHPGLLTRNRGHNKI